VCVRAHVHAHSTAMVSTLPFGPPPMTSACGEMHCFVSLCVCMYVYLCACVHTGVCV